MGYQSIHEAGGKIIAIAEADGGLIDESMKGLDISALKAHHMKKGTITGFPGAQTVCDLLYNLQNNLKTFLRILAAFSTRSSRFSCSCEEEN